MRALFLGLILLNVLYWTWANSVDTPTAQVAQALDPDLPRLELAKLTTSFGAQDVAPVELASNPGEPVADSAEALDVPRVGSDAVLSVDAEAPEVVADAALPAAVEEPADDKPTNVVEEAVTPETPLVALNLLAAVDPVDNPARCVGVGPFVSLRQASEAAALLNQAGLGTSQRVEESQVWVGHWVHLPSFPTRAAAVEVVEQLRKQGIKDIYIEPSGELKNTVSLGLFTELERAEIRAGRVRKLGDVKPQIRNRSRDGLVYWIDAQLEAGVSLDAASLPHNSSQELRTETVDCPPLSASG